ncbi:MAG: malonyl-CoA synthase [Alphaproteobacteria bacterium]
MSDPANLFGLILSRAPTVASAPLLEAGSRTYAWRDMDEASARYARVLTDGGLRKGDRVAVQVEKSPQSLFLYLACLRAGLIYLPMNTAYRGEEVDHLVGNAEPAAVVCAPEAETTRDIAVRHGAALVLTMDADGGGDLAEAATASRPEFPPLEVSPDDVAAILYTSGTTGRPKGAMLSHRNLTANGEALRRSWGFTADDVLLHALPLFHAHGLFVACHCVLLAGARMLWLPAFDRRRVIESLGRATVFMGVPTYYTRLLADPDLTHERCAGVRLFVSGSAPLLPETFEAFRRRTGHAILERYGMTETGMNTSNPLRGERRAGTVGPPLPGVSVRVTDETGAVLADGAVGMLEVRGDNVFSGYWRMPERTALDVTADGWFITGDLAVIEDGGYVRLVGRARDLIITGGYNVYPKEVETVIDAIDGVVESAVIGLPHPDFGEAVTAVVHRLADRDTPDEPSVIAHVRARLADYKVPKRVVFVPELPRNAMGKVQKTQLRADCEGLYPA